MTGPRSKELYCQTRHDKQSDDSRGSINVMMLNRKGRNKETDTRMLCLRITLLLTAGLYGLTEECCCVVSKPSTSTSLGTEIQTDSNPSLGRQSDKVKTR